MPTGCSGPWPWASTRGFWISLCSSEFLPCWYTLMSKCSAAPRVMTCAILCCRHLSQQVVQDGIETGVGEEALMNVIMASVVISPGKLTSSIFLSFLAGSKPRHCCQTSGARHYTSCRLSAHGSHSEWIYNEEPFTEATNHETTAAAGRVCRVYRALLV